MDMSTNIKQILQEVSSGVVDQIVPVDVDVVGVGNIP
jgi:Ni,Fe-hydrogenase III small subunit